MADPQHVENVIQGLRALQDKQLHIIKLSEPVSASASTNRTSDVSASPLENSSPASLEADLTHYKELFSKLRFSYLEQVTKEKFLRAIVGDPPEIAEYAENIRLESELADHKSVLKAQKEYVANIVADLDARGRDLSRRYETIGLQTTLLSSLPPQIEDLNQILTDLRKQNQRTDTDWDVHPSMGMPLPATLELLEERQANLDEVSAQLKSLQQQLPRQTRTLEMEERELRKLETERERVLATAREAVGRRQGGEGTDELEMRGRWLRGVESGLKGMLEVEA